MSQERIRRAFLLPKPDSGIPNRRIDIPVAQIIEMWVAEKPALVPPVSVKDALQKPPLLVEGDRVTPQAWILSKFLLKEGLAALNQRQADEQLATVLGAPRALAILFRHLTNIAPEDGVDRYTHVVRLFTQPTYYLGTATSTLTTLARTLDEMTRQEWETVEESWARKLLDESAQSLLGRPMGIYVRPGRYHLSDITEDAFRRAADMASSHAYGIDPLTSDYWPRFRNDVLVAAGRAALEVVHHKELKAAKHDFVHLGLFGLAPTKEERPIIVKQSFSPQTETQKVSPAVLTSSTQADYTRGELADTLAGVIGLGAVAIAFLGLYHQQRAQASLRRSYYGKYLAFNEAVPAAVDNLQVLQTSLIANDYPSGHYLHNRIYLRKGAPHMDAGLLYIYPWQIKTPYAVLVFGEAFSQSTKEMKNAKNQKGVIGIKHGRHDLRLGQWLMFTDENGAPVDPLTGLPGKFYTAADFDIIETV